METGFDVDATRSSRRTAYILLSLSSLCFAGAWVAGKVAVRTMPPLALATGRFVLASVLLWLWALRAPGAIARRFTRADLALVIGMGLTAVAGYNVLFLYGLRLAPASDGAIIVPGLVAPLTAIISWPLLRERVGRTGALGLALALGGMGLVMSPGWQAGRERFLGDLLFVLGAACWALYSVLGKVVTGRLTPVNATLFGTVAGTLLLVPLAVAENEWAVLVAAPAEAWFGLLYLGAFATVVSFVFLYEGIQRLGATRASSFLLLVPVFGVLLSAALLGERIAPRTMLGGGLVIAGLWLVQRDFSPRRSAAALHSDERRTRP